MTATVLTDVTIYADGFDFTGHASSMQLSVDVDDQDVTTFGTNGWKAPIPGLKSCEVKADVYWQSADSATNDPLALDPEVFNHLGVSQIPVSIGPTRVEGDPVYLLRAGQYNYEVFGDIGDVSSSTLEMSSSDTQGLIRAKWAKIKGNASTPAVALGSVLNLGPVSATQFIYSTLHVFSPGTTMTVKLQSDDNAGFTTPTDVFTFPAITTRTGTWMTRIAGPKTDTYYRLYVSAITGTFSVAGTIGIQ